VPEPDGTRDRVPPIDPPTGCINPLVWRLARRLYADHRPGPDGWCLNCRPAIDYPCAARRLADQGLAAAMGHTGGAPHRGNQGGRW
jgi:hypothetical protein